MELFTIEKDGNLKPYTERVFKDSNQEGISVDFRINRRMYLTFCCVLKGSFGSYVQSH